MINLGNFINNIKTGTAIVNPVDQVKGDVDTMLTNLAGLNTSQEFIDLQASIQAATASVQAAAENVTSKLQTLLPIAKAADKIEKQTKILNDIIPADTGGDNFKAIFGPLTIGKTQMDQFKIDLQNAQADIAAGGAQATAAIASLTAKTSTLSSTITSAVNSATSSFSDSISNLKSYAFGKFLSSEQPEHVKEITSLVTTETPPPAIAKVEAPIAAEILSSNTTEVQAIMPKTPQTVVSEKIVEPNSSPVDIPPPSGPVGGYPDRQAFKNAYYQYLESINADFKTRNEEYVAVRNEFLTYRNAQYPNWEAVEQAALQEGATAEQKAEWETIKANAKNSAKGVELDEARARVVIERQRKSNSEALFRLYSNSQFTNAEPGPPWIGPSTAS